jgi:hypothetical protein
MKILHATIADHEIHAPEGEGKEREIETRRETNTEEREIQRHKAYI